MMVVRKSMEQGEEVPRKSVELPSPGIREVFLKIPSDIIFLF